MRPEQLVQIPCAPVPLPGGGVYIVAGQGTEFGLIVDHGTNGDQAAFCAALSP